MGLATLRHRLVTEFREVAARAWSFVFNCFTRELRDWRRNSVTDFFECDPAAVAVVREHGADAGDGATAEALRESLRTGGPGQRAGGGEGIEQLGGGSRPRVAGIEQREDGESERTEWTAVERGDEMGSGDVESGCSRGNPSGGIGEALGAGGLDGAAMRERGADGIAEPAEQDGVHSMEAGADFDWRPALRGLECGKLDIDGVIGEIGWQEAVRRKHEDDGALDLDVNWFGGGAGAVVEIEAVAGGDGGERFSGAG